MSSNGFQKFSDFCNNALIEDSKPLDIMKLIRKRYKECDEEYTHSDEFYELLVTSHAKILGDRSKFFVYLKDFLNVLKKNKKAKSAGGKRALDSENASDSDVELPTKRIRLDSDDIRANGSHSSDIPENDSRTVAEFLDHKNYTEKEESNSIEIGYEAIKEDESTPKEADQNGATENTKYSNSTKVQGTDNQDKAEEHNNGHVEISEDEADDLPVNKDIDENLAKLAKESLEKSSLCDSNESIDLAETTLEFAVKSKQYIDTTVELDSLSENESIHSAKSPTLDKPKRKCERLLKSSDDESVDGPAARTFAQKHKNRQSENSSRNYDGGSSSEDEHPWKSKKQKKERKQKKYKISVGKGSKNKSPKHSDTSPKQQKHINKKSKPNRSNSPRKSSPKKKSPINSPKISPVIIVTESESDDDQGKPSINANRLKHSDKKCEPEIKLVKVRLKLERVDVESPVDEKAEDPTVSQSDHKEQSGKENVDVEIDEGEIKSGEGKTDENQSKDECKTGEINENQSKEKSKPKRVPFTTEVLYGSSFDDSTKHDSTKHKSSKAKHFENPDDQDSDLDEPSQTYKQSPNDQGRNPDICSRKQDKHRDHDSRKNSSKARQKDDVHPSTSADTADASNGNAKAKKGSTKQIKRLEELLVQIRDKIEKVRTQELDLDDLDSGVSDYILEDKLKQKFIKVWNKLCELHNSATSTGRPTEKYFRYQGTRYPDVNRKIEKFINKKKVFPDYHDVRNIIMKVNKDKKLHLRSNMIDDLAREAFTDVGNKLQSRRKKDFALGISNEEVNFFSVYDDPALYDTELKRKLDSNKKAAKTNIEQVVDKYARLQYEKGDQSDGEDEDEEDEEEDGDDDLMKGNQQTKNIDTDVARLLQQDEGLDNYDSGGEGISNVTQNNEPDRELVTPITQEKKEKSHKEAETYSDTKSQFLGEVFGLQQTTHKPAQLNPVEQLNNAKKETSEVNVISIDSDDEVLDKTNISDGKDEQVLISSSKPTEVGKATIQLETTKEQSSFGEHRNNVKSGIKRHVPVVNKKVDDKDLIVIDIDEEEEYENNNLEDAYYEGDEYYDQYYQGYEGENEEEFDTGHGEDNEYYGQDNYYTHSTQDVAEIIEVDPDDPPLEFKISSPRHISEDDHFKTTGETKSGKTYSKHFNTVASSSSQNDTVIDLSSQGNYMKDNHETKHLNNLPCNSKQLSSVPSKSKQMNNLKQSTSINKISVQGSTPTNNTNPPTIALNTPENSSDSFPKLSKENENKYTTKEIHNDTPTSISYIEIDLDDSESEQVNERECSSQLRQTKKVDQPIKSDSESCSVVQDRHSEDVEIIDDEEEDLVTDQEKEFAYDSVNNKSSENSQNVIDKNNKVIENTEKIRTQSEVNKSSCGNELEENDEMQITEKDSKFETAELIIDNNDDNDILIESVANKREECPNNSLLQANFKEGEESSRESEDQFIAVPIKYYECSETFNELEYEEADYEGEDEQDDDEYYYEGEGEEGEEDQMPVEESDKQGEDEEEAEDEMAEENSDEQVEEDKMEEEKSDEQSDEKKAKTLLDKDKDIAFKKSAVKINDENSSNDGEEGNTNYNESEHDESEHDDGVSDSTNVSDSKQLNTQATSISKKLKERIGDKIQTQLVNEDVKIGSKIDSDTVLISSISDKTSINKKQESDSVDSCMSVVKLDDLPADDGSNHYESVPDIFEHDSEEEGEGERYGSDTADDDNSDCSEGLLSPSSCMSKTIENAEARINQISIDPSLKTDKKYTSQIASLSKESDSGTGICSKDKKCHDLQFNEENSVESDKVDCISGDITEDEEAEAKTGEISSENSSDDEDAGSLNEEETVSDKENMVTSNEEVVSNSIEDADSIVETVVKIKHPDVRSRLMKLEKAVTTKCINRKPINHCVNSHPLWNADDEHIDLIENYEEPDSCLSNHEHNIVSSKTHVIELSDSD